MTSPSPSSARAEFLKLRPRERMYGLVLDELASLNARATSECREPACGERGEDGEVTSCSSVNCGEKLMRDGWWRRLIVMRDFKALIEGLERAELAKLAAADKKGKRS